MKTLLRFRCICKSWRAIIDEPGFTFIHLNLFNKNHDATRLLTMEAKGSDPTLNVEHMKNPTKPTEAIVSLNGSGTPYVTVMGSANGLLLMGTKSWQIALVNPSTKRALDLPRAPIAPLINKFNAAVGFDPLSNDVKVVVIPATLKASYYKVEAMAIYKLSTRSWMSMSVINNNNSSCSWYLKAHRPLFSGGALHWLARDANNEDDHCPTHVAIFNLGTEKFNFIRLPNGDKVTEDKARFPLLIGESMGVLDVTSQRLNIRVMRKHGKHLSWTKWFRSNIPINTYNQFRSWCDCALLLVENFGKLLIKGDSVRSYDFETRRFEQLTAYNAEKYIGHHVESLAFHKGWPLPNDHI